MLLKKLISYCLLPFPIVLVLLGIGVLLLWFTSRQRTGRIAVSLGLGFLVLLSWEPTSHWMMVPLARFKPLQNPAVSAAGARWVVVLAGGYDPSPGMPATVRLSGYTLERLIEGIRIYRALPGSKLVMSGGGVPGHPPGETTASEVMVQAAEALGVPRADTVQEATSLDTQDQSVRVREVVGKDRFVLVTSIVHMRRSLGLFEKQGMTPIPAPAGFSSTEVGFTPSVRQVAVVEDAEHEYFGMLWSRLRGQL
jgi:uncharacterized SAM-binding protein YcdF (DUF218 family)